jgi:hypothetical protein
MSDFITGLRGDLVDADERYGRRSAVRRTWPRVWRPALAAATVVAGALAVLVTASTLSPAPDVRPAISATVRIGGQPQDAVLAGGSLWVTDFGGRVLRVDPADGRVIARIAVDGNPRAIAAGAGGVWVASPGLAAKAESVLSRIDPDSGRVVQRVRVGGYADTVAVGAGGVWIIDQQGRRIERIGKPAASVPFGRIGTLAVGGDTLWAIDSGGTVASVDGRSLKTDRLPRLVPFGHGPAENTLAADAGGVWVAGRGGGELVRIEAGNVVTRVPIPEVIGPIALGDGVAWAVSGDPEAPSPIYRLTEVDRESGEVLASLSVGYQQPKALVPAGDDVWVIAADGTATRVGK